MSESPETCLDQDWGTKKEGDTIGAKIEKLKKTLGERQKGERGGTTTSMGLTAPKPNTKNQEHQEQHGSYRVTQL